MNTIQDGYFAFSYEGTTLSIRKDQEGQYIFTASISCDPYNMSSAGNYSVVCARDTLEKAVELIKQKNFDKLKDQIEFDPFWQEWRMGLDYPYLQLGYSLDGESLSLQGDTEEDWAKVTVYSPVFPVVMTLLHELAVLFNKARHEAPVPNVLKHDHEKLLYKVQCPFCEKMIDPKLNYCSMCGKSLIGVNSFIASEEEVDLDETIHLCKYCRNDVS